VTRIGRRDIEVMRPVSVLDLIDGTPGVRAISVGGIGGGTFLSVRGGEPNFTLVTIEGLKLNNPTNSRGGAFDLSLIDPDLVESITIVRGPTSAIHGSDALSGLVSIRLGTGGRSGFGGAARGLTSSEAETGATLRLEDGWAGGSAAASGGFYDSGNLSPGSELQRSQALFHLRQEVGTFLLSGFALHARTTRQTFPEDSGGPLLAVNQELERGTITLNAGIVSVRRDPTAAVRPNLSLSWSEQQDEVSTPFIAPGTFDGVPASTSQSRFRRLEAIADVGLDLGPVTAILGGAVLREEGRSEGTLDLGFPLPTGFRLNRTTYSGFAEAAWRQGAAFNLNLAGRADKLADGATSWTWRGTARWRPGEGRAELTASFAEGYKLPSFFALAHPLIGNPDLRAERSTNAEVGLSLPLGSSGQIKLTLFRNRFTDLVDFDASAFRFVNRARVRTAGGEFEMNWRPARTLEVAGALTYLDTDSATPLRNRPSWQGTLRLTWRTSDVMDLTALVRANSDFFDASIPTGLITADGHASLDIVANYRLTSRLRLDIALRNLTGADYQDAVGFPATGRLVRAALAVHF
jgi:outer membrane cobalamin receptor